MKRPTVTILIALALLIAAAFFFHRSPGEEKPTRPPPRRAPIVEQVPPEPVPIVREPPKAPPSPLPPRGTPPPPPLVPVYSPAAPPGFLRGRVKIQGELPRRRTARMDSDPKCQERHAGPVLLDDIVADANGFVQWAFVYVQSGLKGPPPPPPQTPVTLDQIACTFTPHMVGVRVGQPVVILNSDPLLHNVHGLPFQNKEFNIGLPQAGLEIVRRFDKPEVMIKLKCEIHPWMVSWVGVLDHPYFSVTNETGSYGIPALPPGRYTVQAWHEKYVTVSSDVDLPPGGDVVLDFLLDVKKE
jgi:plastocyanin